MSYCSYFPEEKSPSSGELQTTMVKRMGGLQFVSYGWIKVDFEVGLKIGGTLHQVAELVAFPWSVSICWANFIIYKPFFREVGSKEAHGD